MGLPQWQSRGGRPRRLGRANLCSEGTPLEVFATEGTETRRQR